MGVIALTVFCATASSADQSADRFQPMDVFQLEYASDPQISPDGKQVVYVRNFMDIKKDRRRSHLWIVNADGSEHRPLTDGDGQRPLAALVAGRQAAALRVRNADDGPAQLYCRWMDTGQTARLAQLPAAPSELAWSPDGKSIAFVMHVADRPEPFVELPPKPEGRRVGRAVQGDPHAELPARRQGLSQGRLPPCLRPAGRRRHAAPADQGTARASRPAGLDARWQGHCSSTANRHPEGEHDPLNTEIYEVAVADGAIKALTNRQGPDGHPAVSPDGKQIAYLGFDDKRQGYQVTRLYVMNRDGTGCEGPDRPVRPRRPQPGLEPGRQAASTSSSTTRATPRSASSIRWRRRSRRVAEHVGGTTLDRPYASGSFSVAGDGTVAFTLTSPDRPADVAVRRPGDKEARRLTQLNDSLLGHKALGTVEEIRYKSSHDGRQIQGWIVKPPASTRRRSTR